MNIVTLTTDFGLQDYYSGIIKGALLRRSSDINIVDITHQIQNYDIVRAAYVLSNVYSSFPEGTIHILSVNNYYSKRQAFIAIRKNNHYFIGPNNGVFSLMFEEPVTEAYELDLSSKEQFPLKELYADAVAHIISGRPFNEIGVPAKKVVERITLQPVISTSQIRGTIIHIDNFENAIINISQELFERVRKKRRFSLHFKRYDPLNRVCKNYFDVPVGETLCLFNSAGYLEIAINQGRAGSLLGLKVDDTIQIDFHS